ncbi:ammonium transporter [Methanopyrus sp.]
MAAESIAKAVHDALATWGAQGPGAILFLVWAAVLVVGMQLGFMFLEAGQVRTKNVVSVLMKNLLDLSLGGIVFILFGFALAFPDYAQSIGKWIATMFTANPWSADPMKAADPYNLAYCFFQFAFCATAATIVSGAVAERINFKAYLVMTVLITGILYPIFVLWTWGGGWMGGDTGLFAKVFGQPYHDFAGSTVVHALGGFLAMAAAYLLGPRIGRFKDGKPVPIPGHNIPQAFLGALFLAITWYGFNVGSSAVLYDPTNESWISSLVAINTTLAMCGGAAAAAFATRFDPLWAANGLIAGLVAICAGCDIMSPIGALITGIVAGLIIKPAFRMLEKLEIDDVVAACPVHGFAGVWGAIAAGIFGTEALGGAGGVSLAAQIVGAIVCVAWALGAGFVTFYLIDKMVGLRATEEEEKKGLDETEFGVSAYPYMETRE